MAWHENRRPALQRAEKRRARKQFKEALIFMKLSEEEVNILVKLYDKGHGL